MSHLRTLLASATAAIALAIISPLFIGAVPAFADGPHMGPPRSMPRTTTVVNQQAGPIIQRATVNVSGRNNVVNIQQQAIINQVNINRSVNVNNVNINRHFPNRFNNCCNSFPVVQPVAVPVPVYTPVYTPTYTTTYVSACVVSYSQPYPWMSYGPNWNAGCTGSQLQSFCQQYNQAVQADPLAYNQYVQQVCNTMISGPSIIVQPSSALPGYYP